MRSVDFTLEHENWEEQRDARRCNPALVLLFRDRTGNHRATISAGDSDYVHCFREGSLTYVLSINPGLGYAGLEVFEGAQQVGNTFLQVDYEIAEILGPRGLDLEPITIAKRLADYALAY